MDDVPLPLGLPDDDATLQAQAERSLQTRRAVGDVLPPELRNVGYSAGLEYPYIHRDLDYDDRWLIWHRHTGVIVEILIPDNPMRGMQWAGERCRALNGLRDPTAAEIAALNALHDVEP